MLPRADWYMILVVLMLMIYFCTEVRACFLLCGKEWHSHQPTDGL